MVIQCSNQLIRDYARIKSFGMISLGLSEELCDETIQKINTYIYSNANNWVEASAIYGHYLDGTAVYRANVNTLRKMFCFIYSINSSGDTTTITVFHVFHSRMNIWGILEADGIIIESRVYRRMMIRRVAYCLEYRLRIPLKTRRYLECHGYYITERRLVYRRHDRMTAE
ncbi:MAG: hypothetical protein IIY06_08080 [Proteobacteria bacterium]|jgi:hypothetical protein|nr:hypothetical protein [Pseudomonadota bacterium]